MHWLSVIAISYPLMDTNKLVKWGKRTPRLRKKGEARLEKDT